MMAVILYCGFCATGFAPVGVVPAVCPECNKETKWIVAPFALTRDDKLFLKVNKIDPE